jgi:hypothetical protein
MAGEIHHIIEVRSMFYKGDPGQDGKSAYQTAVDGGFHGTEQELAEQLASIGELEVSMDYIATTLEAIVAGSVIARRGAVAPYIYIMYGALHEAFNGEAGQTSVINMFSDQILSDKIEIDNNTDITLRCGGGERIVGRGFKGDMFLVKNGKFTLDGPILRGSADGGGQVVRISNGIFILQSGKITDNDNLGGDGGGVYVNGGAFIMNGGYITENKSRNTSSGGGVIIYSPSGSAVFKMTGGEISDNIGGQYGGGGIRVDNGLFTYDAGTIHGNTTVNGGTGTQVKKESNGRINGSGGVTEGYGATKTYDIWPPQP